MSVFSSVRMVTTGEALNVSVICPLLLKMISEFLWQCKVMCNRLCRSPPSIQHKVFLLFQTVYKFCVLRQRKIFEDFLSLSWLQ